MEERIWAEIKQARKNSFYCIFLAASKRRFLNYYNIFIIACSGTGVMGWSIWKNPELAGIACSIIAITSLLKATQLYIIPSEKQIDQLDSVINFYFDYNNKLECLWLDFYNDRITEEKAQELFYEIKNSEKATTQSINEVVKKTHKKIGIKAENETVLYLKTIFNC